MIIRRAREVLLNLNGPRLFSSENEDYFTLVKNSIIILEKQLIKRKN